MNLGTHMPDAWWWEEDAYWYWGL